ncbi:hypothetical protein TM49_10550 [Martelella endophytica]|uniref:DUF1176 domain-containing protein n=2 Tax=Martelella endophytica TaxID=1486262 RepID=A0A0D5LQG6_MAREN|nr:hypothetical protein TM49_10550 [Martelella endophytica]
MATVALFMGGAVPAASAFEYRQIEGWAVSCNNAYGCTISLTPSAGGGANGSELAAIQWHRTSAPNAPLTLSLPFPPGFFQKGDPKGQYRIVVDGVEAFSTGIAGLAEDDALGAFGISDPDTLMVLFRRMSDGHSATISYSGGLGAFSADIALTGLATSARFVDTLQSRDGHTDALVETGLVEPPADPAVWAISRYDQLPDSILRNLSDKNSACYTDEQHLQQSDAFAFKGNWGTMVLLPCGPSGAYNQPYQMYVGKDEDFHRAEFPNVSDAGITVLDTVYNVNFDLKNLKLTSVFLGRGLGDCGLAHYWKIESQLSGNPLVLTHERAKNACDGTDVGAEHWPISWRSEIRIKAEEGNDDD